MGNKDTSKKQGAKPVGVQRLVSRLPLADEMMEFQAARAALEKYNKAVMTVVHGANEIDLPFCRIARMCIDRQQQVLNEIHWADAALRFKDGEELAKLVVKIRTLLSEESPESANRVVTNTDG